MLKLSVTNGLGSGLSVKQDLPSLVNSGLDFSSGSLREGNREPRDVDTLV